MVEGKIGVGMMIIGGMVEKDVYFWFACGYGLFVCIIWFFFLIMRGGFGLALFTFLDTMISISASSVPREAIDTTNINTLLLITAILYDVLCLYVIYLCMKPPLVIRISITPCHGTS